VHVLGRPEQLAALRWGFLKSVAKYSRKRELVSRIVGHFGMSIGDVVNASCTTLMQDGPLHERVFSLGKGSHSIPCLGNGHRVGSARQISKQQSPLIMV